MTRYYVSQENGNNKNSGLDLDHAWKSLAMVQKMQKPGDVIEFHGGEYAGQIIKTNRVTWLGFDGAAFDGDKGTNPNALLVFADNVTIRGLEFRDAKHTGVAVAAGADYFTMSDSWSHHNDGHGLSLIGGTGYNIVNSEFSYNYGLKSNSIHATSGVSLFHPRALDNYERAYGAKFIGIHSHHNGNEGLSDGGGLIIDKADRDTPHPYDTPILIKDSFFHENGGPGAYVYKSDNVVFRDNFFWHNSQDKDRPRGMEIGLNNASNIKMSGDIAEASHDRFVFSHTGLGNSAQINDEIWYTDGYDRGDLHIIAPWSGNSMKDPGIDVNTFGVDPEEMFPWWPHPDGLDL